VVVPRNDQVGVDGVVALKPRHIVLSPGPCTPDEAGICLELIERLQGRFPILGVCLGHQAIGQAFGGKVIRARQVMHGKTSPIYHCGEGVFRNVPSPFVATRYHSLIVAREDLPADLQITAWTQTPAGEKDEIMGFKQRHYPLEGVQFHPESILTEYGPPVGSHSYAAPSVAVLISTSDWSMAKLGGAWKAHHTERSRALVALLKLAQRRVVREGRPPLPPIRLVHVVTDGHGVVDAGFNASCTCKSQATCCDPRRRRSAEPPDAPAWAAVACACSWDVSVPWALHTFTDVGSEGALDRGARQYTRMAAGAPWERRERKAFHVGDRKAWL